MSDLLDQVVGIVGTDRALSGDAIRAEYTHDEALTCEPHRPEMVVLPISAQEVSEVVVLANSRRVPVTARGAGTGLSGACVPARGGILLSFELMNAIVEIDTQNHVAVVQPGVTLDELDAATAAEGLICPIYPGENSATLGGNVATNAGGMRAVKYGVTRHQVLGLEAVLPTGEVIHTGGKYVKATTGYDLTQLIVGSEGTLAVVTEIILRLHPRPEHSATILAPFSDIDAVTSAVPKIIASAVQPVILEYVDMMSMAATTANVGLDLGIPEEVREAALAYLIVVLEGSHPDRLEEDLTAAAEQVSALGALDVYVLPPASASKLLEAREKAFWVAKQNGADDIVDVVVPRASIPGYLERVAELAREHEAFVGSAGHVGDGNVHLAVFQPDPDRRRRLMRSILSAGIELGGTISAEHGIGSEKLGLLADLEDPAKLDLMQRIKAAFDPNRILNPGTLLEDCAPGSSPPVDGPET